MITIRPFTNSDPPALLDVWWRWKATTQENAFPLSYDMLEDRVFGQLFFDRKGLLIAWDDSQDWDGGRFWGGHRSALRKTGRPVGLVHGILLPNQREVGLDPLVGVICRLLVPGDVADPPGIRTALLDACETYMKEQGIKTVYGGAMLGGMPLFDRSTLPISFPCSSSTHQTLAGAGYSVHSRTTWFRMSLENYRPPVSLDVIRWQGKARLETKEYAFKGYWDAVSKGNHKWLDTKVLLTDQAKTVGRILVRITDFPAPQNSEQAALFDHPTQAELITFDVRPEYLGKGLLQFALGRHFHDLWAEQHIGLLVTMLTDDLASSIPTLRALHLQEYDRGTMFVKHFE